MNRFAAAWVVARRDFLAIAGTPTFIFFLLAPLLMIGLSVVGGMSASSLGEGSERTQRLIAMVPVEEQAAFVATDVRLRTLLPGREPPRLIVMENNPAHRTALAPLRADPEVLAILTGSAARPVVAERTANSGEGRYLVMVADAVARGGVAASAEGGAARAAVREPLGNAQGTTRAAQSGIGYAAVFVLFLLVLMLGGQSVGTLAEEKGNKVIEILAAAVPLESVFFGKLVGMLGVALLFVAFWAVIIAVGGAFALTQMNLPATVTGAAPSLGWPLFLAFGFVYFLMGFLLLGAVFLGLGALASSVREIQMLSLPITLFQVGMFSLGSAAAHNPGTTVATVAQWLPWSSPFAMAAFGATDAALWPHLLALVWQLAWLALSIWVAVRLFRYGVLRSGPLINWRKAPAAVADEQD